MAVINDVKQLIVRSKLFVHADKIEKSKKKTNLRKSDIKIGQGGTLDPLADGVLGAKRLAPREIKFNLDKSGRSRQSHKKTVPILGMYQGS
jgi:hypothetical protein